MTEEMCLYRKNKASWARGVVELARKALSGVLTQRPKQKDGAGHVTALQRSFLGREQVQY